MPSTTALKERPITLREHEVRDILAGRLTELRRVLKDQPANVIGKGHAEVVGENWRWMRQDFASAALSRLPFWTELRCPFGLEGETRLWGREAWRTEERAEDLVDGIRFRADDGFQPIENIKQAVDLWMEAAHFKADLSQVKPICGGIRVATRKKRGTEWRSPIHMPRWASRLTLALTAVRVQRLQEITEAEAIAEGYEASTIRWWQGFERHEDGSRSAVEGGASPDGPPPEWMESPGLQTMTTTAVDRFRVGWDSIYGHKPGLAWADSPWTWVLAVSRVEAAHDDERRDA